MTEAEDIAAAFGVDQCARCGRLRLEGEEYHYETGWTHADTWLPDRSVVKICGAQCYLLYTDAAIAARQARAKQELDAVKLAARRSMPKFFGIGDE